MDIANNYNFHFIFTKILWCAIFAFVISFVFPQNVAYSEGNAVRYQYVEAKRDKLALFVAKSTGIWKRLDPQGIQFFDDELTMLVLQQTSPTAWKNNEARLFSAKFIIIPRLPNKSV